MTRVDDVGSRDRARKLGQIRFAPAASSRPIHILIDSTGLKIHVGNLRKPPRNRDWRKLHVAVNPQSGHVVATELTTKAIRDCARVPALLKQIESRLASVSADGAYDKQSVYEAIENHTDTGSPRVLIPPEKNAQLKPEAAVLRERNRNIRSRARLGRRRWHTKSGYSRRSIVENAIYRYKAIIGTDMRSRASEQKRSSVGRF